MSLQPSKNVSDILSSIGARMLRSGEIGSGLSLAEWENTESQAAYDNPGHHTLSLYLDGGQRIYRRDGKSAITGGAPDKVCLLPSDHVSAWDICERLHMFHLYIEPAELNRIAVQSFDMDPRLLQLQDLTFAEDDFVANIVRTAILPQNWEDRADRMVLNSAANLLIVNLLKNHTRKNAALAVRGGLAPAVRGRVADYVEANLDQPLTLDDLAAEAGLSAYHFAKMFKISFGQPPHRYVTDHRISKAKELLADASIRLADVALACGFSSQSHFTNSFRRYAGVTPRRFRQGY